MEQARVEIEWGWESPEDMRDMEEWLRSDGIAVKAEYIPPAGNGVGFLLPISVYDVALVAFISGFVGAAGADAWKATKHFTLRAKSWFKRRYPQKPPADQVTLILRHPESRVIVYISSEMPDEGFRKLHKLELGSPNGVRMGRQPRQVDDYGHGEAPLHPWPTPAPRRTIGFPATSKCPGGADTPRGRHRRTNLRRDLRLTARPSLRPCPSGAPTRRR